MIALLLAILPASEPIVDRVDLIEVNHVYDGRGKHVFDQLIFWDWSEDRYEVRAWRLLKTKGQWPEKRGQDWVATMTDGERLREIRATIFRETWTQYDPEVWERDRTPKERRRGLLLQSN